MAVDKDHIKTYVNEINNSKGTLTIPEFTVLAGTIDNGQYSGEGDAKVVINGKATSNWNLNGNRQNIEINGEAVLNANNGKIVMGSSNAKVSMSTNIGEIDNTNDGTINIAQNGTEGTIFYEFTSDVNGDLIPEATTYNTVKLTKMTWKPTDDSDILSGKKLILNEATVACYVADKTIKVESVYVENSSNIKGHADATLAVSETITGKADKSLTISGMKVTENGLEKKGKIEF